ncbi:MAG: Asp/Glu racemase, partial [Kiloniellales bacterium]|nr:Asp/Glu racemase [Kiloniellales bacterium]
VIDPFFMRLMAGLPVELFINRVRFLNPVTPANLKALSDDLNRACEDLLSDEPLDVIAFGCSSGAVEIGEAALAAKIQVIKPGTLVTNPVTAAVAAFAALGVRRISLLAPYVSEVAAGVADYFRDRNLDLASVCCFGIPDDRDIARITPAAIKEGAKLAMAPDAEAIFLSCTGMRAGDEAAVLEDELGIPVVTSNQALAWHALRLSGCDKPVLGYGRLLTLPMVRGEAA